MIDYAKRPCPKCKRKGLHYSMHPHAYGHKDYSRLKCRFCKASFKLKLGLEQQKRANH